MTPPANDDRWWRDYEPEQLGTLIIMKEERKDVLLVRTDGAEIECHRAIGFVRSPAVLVHTSTNHKIGF
jgi:hypothetical protein